MTPNHPDAGLPTREKPSEGLTGSDLPGTTGSTFHGANPDTRTIVGDNVDRQAEPTIGTTIGKYAIRSFLGEGGMGAVYLAFDPLIEREVAIKVLTHEVSKHPASLQRFLGEARAIGRLNHPNVVSIYDIDQWNGRYFLVMEFLSGGSLAESVETRGALDWKEACEVIAQAANGLAAAHGAGMVHRDIKPENLMRTKDGIVKVVDFGLSKLTEAADDTRTAVTKAGQILGTPHYMSPEQFESKEIDARADIYGLGATLFRLLTGRYPYHDCPSVVQVMTAHLTKPAPVPTQFSSSIPKECDRIVARAMAKRAADRYSTATELATELLALVQSQGPGERTVPVNEPIDGDRPLESAVIVEPTRMLAAMLKDAVSRTGAASVEAVQTGHEAARLVQHHAPDLLITAMQLPDGKGIDLLETLCRNSQMHRTTVVLHSSDSTIDDLLAVGPAANLILAPKKARPDHILHVAHAGGPCVVKQGPLAVPVDPLAVRLVVVIDSERAPDALADMVRELHLLDVSVTNDVDAAFAESATTPTVVIVLRTAGTAAGDATTYAKAAARAEIGRNVLVAAVQIDGTKLFLRATGWQGVVSVVCRPLDAKRVASLVQACRA